ncbi:MAG: T9SS type A sorting domain-containing protein, partial [Flavobacteriales bacterium]
YLWDGIVYDSTGSYTNTYTAVNGCDSIVTLTLTINISTSSIDDVGNHCDSYTWIDGVTYTTTNTTATMDYTNAAGCDSIVTLNLIINDNPVVSISSSNNILSAITTGGTSPYSYLWTGALNSTNAIVTPIASGDYCVQVTDANGCVSSEVCENVIINAINDLYLSKFNVYPNPTSDFVTLDFNTVIKGDYTVKIISSNGDQVYEHRILDFNGDYTKNINLSNLAKGNYIIQIHSDHQVVYRKILLQ